MEALPEKTVRSFLAAMAARRWDDAAAAFAAAAARRIAATANALEADSADRPEPDPRTALARTLESQDGRSRFTGWEAEFLDRFPEFAKEIRVAAAKWTSSVASEYTFLPMGTLVEDDLAVVVERPSRRISGWNLPGDLVQLGRSWALQQIQGQWMLVCEPPIGIPGGVYFAPTLTIKVGDERRTLSLDHFGS